MNAVREFCRVLDRRSVIATLGTQRQAASFSASSTGTPELRDRLVRRYQDSLAEFLNRSARSCLEMIGDEYKLDTLAPVAELRSALWIVGATLEANGAQHLGSAYQPTPIVLSGRLVFQGAVHGQCPDSEAWPRPVPPAREVAHVDSEPESMEELLHNANGLVGLRLGARGRDKGAWGTKAAELLGVRERGFAEADWRGEVEIKTLPVARDAVGWWQVKEDPAISMESVDPRIKLNKVLWIARVSDEPDSPILSWYYQEWDARVQVLAARYLHHRPKGPKGTTSKGWYMQKRFFLYSGFLRSLNG
ncbi:MAG: hypothetical protein JKY56_27295 [Kofleriaceae bacterium]|nr:hypothetical protein [Kofleriaceae bacterium]